MIRRSCARLRDMRSVFTDYVTAGKHDITPRADEDFEYVGGEQVLPGAHPLPLSVARDPVVHPHISPYMPSPQRQHPYFNSPLEELPHFKSSVPIVYPYNTMKAPIVVPVFNLNGEVTHTRELDPFIFGFYPQVNVMNQNSVYWQVRAQNYASMWDFERKEIWKRSRKPWANTGTGRYRAKDLKSGKHPDGARTHPNKPWTMKMPSILPSEWSASNRMMLTLKMLQGRLQIVDRLTTETPTVDSFIRLCHSMRWDVRSLGGGVLFMDGGSRLTPSIEFDKNFFYGSFYNGRLKVVRPTIHCDAPYDWNFTGAQKTYLGPKGPKNPIPLNRFNCYDALSHERVVISEGALFQLEQECLEEKVQLLPPHIRNQMAAAGMLDNSLLGDKRSELHTIEMESSRRIEEKEATMYEGYYDNPYDPWADEKEASYVVDGVEGTISREVKGKKASWTMLE